MDTFEREISFMSLQLNDANAFELKLTSKTATFNELSRTEKEQHKLHFKIVSLFTNAEKDEETGKINLDSDTIYDLTIKSIKQLLVINPSFTAQDKVEFLNDSGAIFNFGYWMLGEKVTPFFSTLMTK